jgi:glycogen debranching enzyme
VTDPWLFEDMPGGESRGETEVALMEGTTFCISDGAGDIRPQHSHGLFVRDTRMLSEWVLTIDGQVPFPLAVQSEDPHSSTFLGWLSPGRGRGHLMCARERHVGEGMREDLTLRNGSSTPVTVTLTLRVGADFADLFEVKDGRALDLPAAPGIAEGRAVTLSRRSGEREYAVVVSAEDSARADRDALRWTAEIPGHGSWTTTVEVVPQFDGESLALHHPRGAPVHEAAPARRHREWWSQVPTITTTDRDLSDLLRNSIADIATLRIFSPEHPDRPVVAAGAPWFMALFGRDSLLTSLMLLPVDLRLAIGTLQTLAEHQGTRTDPATEEEPGRVLHEMRFGPTAALSLGGQSAYYGTVDASPLFVVLLAEVQRWGAPDEVVAALLPHADRALEWMERYGDFDGDGFLEYQRKTDRGLVNQGWKDSWDGINFADGRIAQSPIALAEAQAYAYAAYQGRARLAAVFGDVDGAGRWAERARALKAAFNKEFWLPDRGWYAVGLDGDKQPIDALTSNIGHCLWAGIVDDDKADAVARHLTSPELFSGWGIRTLATSMGAFDPMSYHNGSVWPHDTVLAISGLARYGFRRGAARIAVGLVEASASFGHRLPELFAGFDREQFRFPVPYPAACSPQAWAAAAPVELLRALLDLQPGDPPSCDPQVPERFLPLRIRGLSAAGYELDVDESGWQIRDAAEVSRAAGLAR